MIELGRLLHDFFHAMSHVGHVASEDINVFGRKCKPFLQATYSSCHTLNKASSDELSNSATWILKMTSLHEDTDFFFLIFKLVLTLQELLKLWVIFEICC